MSSRNRLPVFTGVTPLPMGRKTPPQHYADSLETDKELYKKFHRAMLQNGVYLLPDGRWYVGASHTPKELNLVCAAITRSLNALQVK
ncbi:MAG: hypothetical protein JJU05_08670 [Verrucomicrobia bacterium]|nr:hypothetical protein [Verrucomicrobiota bacterium]MCH8527849.1 hypothetical protein [Kiritimatiellia bacterium]